MTYVMTDDPADPCGYCVQWVEPDEDPDLFGDNAVPMTPDGPADRLYRFTHDDCEASVLDYVAETA